MALLDHLVVTAPDLDAGARYVEQALGVAPQPGGEHARMGTHNRLLRLGESIYLEVIAVNPQAMPPGRPRWFGLDHPAAPRLAAWVARTAHLDAALGGCLEPPGRAEPMSRGALSWRITMPPNGSLPLGGAAPLLIEWQTQPHPAERLNDLGCSLVKLQAFHPEAWRLSAQLESLRFSGPVEVASGVEPYLVALIATPAGLRALA